MKRKILATIAVVGLLGAVSAAAGAETGAAVKTTTVQVKLVEWKLVPSPTRVSAGKVVFVVKNAGKLVHGFAVVKTDRQPGALPMKGAKANVKPLAELKSIAPGRTLRLSVTLAPGKYVLLCNLPAHYKAGQYAGFVVRKS